MSLTNYPKAMNIVIANNHKCKLIPLRTLNDYVLFFIFQMQIIKAHHQNVHYRWNNDAIK